MKRTTLLISAVTILVLFGCVLSVIFLRPMETWTKRTFAVEICANLLAAGYILDEADCYISERVPDVMQSMFPTGSATIDQVRSGMDGFEIILYSSGSPCLTGGMKWERLKFVVIRKFLFRFDENYGFTFCDGILVDQYWEN